MDIVKYGQDMGNSFLLTGLIASVVWLQGIYPGVAPAFLIIGAFLSIYSNWIARRVARLELESALAKPCEEIDPRNGIGTPPEVI